MKKKFEYLLILLISASSLFVGCKKESQPDEELDTDTQMAKENAQAESVFSDVNNIASQALQNDSLTYYRPVDDQDLFFSSACASITRVDTSGHGILSVYFGSNPCLCRDNRYRKGTIQFIYSGAYRDSGTVIQVSFDNYYVGSDSTNMHQVTGTKTIENRGHNAFGNFVFAINVNGSLRNNTGQTLTWNSSRQREWVLGESTIGNWQDDEYMITGSANGTGFNGTTFTLTITQRLHVALNCRWIKDGKFDFTPGAKATRHFDYGAGGCDYFATVTINGVSFAIFLQ